MGDKRILETGRKGQKGLDITIKFFDSLIRVMDSLRKSLDVVHDRYQEQDDMVNNGVGCVEDKKLTHGISLGAVNTGVYGAVDLVYNSNTEEYLVLTKMGEIIRYDWTGSKLGVVNPSKKFSRFIYIPDSGNYIGYNPGKSGMYILKDEFHLAIDTVSISPIDKIVYGGTKTDDNAFEFYIVNNDTLNRYSYNPTSNTVTLQECLKIPEIESDGAVIEQICFDQAMDEKKQWIYLTYRQHCTVIDAAGRSHGTKKNLHRLPITAIVVVGASEFIVTGDQIGLLKMWGSRWAFITEIRPHSSVCTHLIEHPNGRAVISFSADQTVFSWSLDSKKKLESLKPPEIIEKITVNQAGKRFMTLGPRKIAVWKMEVLFIELTPMSAPVSYIDMTWHPDYNTRVVVVSQDNAVRLLNPLTGKIITTALVNPQKPPITDVAYIPQYGLLYVIRTPPDDINALEIQIFDCSVNPCKIRETWTEGKWNNVGITAIALYENIPSMVLAEKILTFNSKKNKENNEAGPTAPTIFLIVGTRDGTIGRMDIKTGNIDYKVSCHKGQVTRILVNPEISQFVTLGNEPNIRIWKINSQDGGVFIPLFETTWKFPVRHVAVIREVICFALSHHDSETHKIVVFNMLDTERYDHRPKLGHTKEVFSVSGHRQLKIFCSSSLDQTIRIWNDKCDLVRLLALNWVPSYAAFGSPQGDIFVGIDNSLNVIAANIYLPIIYRNRAMVSKLDAGGKENSVPLQRTTQDPRMYLVLEEEDRNERERKEKEREKEKGTKRFIPPGETAEEDEKKDTKIPPIESYSEPNDSQRAKDYEKYRFWEEDLKQILEGNHQFSIFVPDFHKMTKKQLDDYGKTIFTGEDGDKRKLFASEARVAGTAEMDRVAKDLDNFVED